MNVNVRKAAERGERDQSLMNIEVSIRRVALLILRCNNITSHVPHTLLTLGQTAEQ